jgi:hypothetical protein
MPPRRRKPSASHYSLALIFFLVSAFILSLAFTRKQPVCIISSLPFFFLALYQLHRARKS